MSDNDYNYSIDVLKKSMFMDELNNLLSRHKNDETYQVIIKYLQERIKEIDEKYKNWKL